MTANQTISDMLQREKLFPKSPLVFYEGGFELQTVDKLIMEIDEQTNTGKFGVKLKKKAFNIGVEVLQNLFHSLSNTKISAHRTGLFSLYVVDSSLYIMTGNYFDNAHINRTSMFPPGPVKAFA